MTAPTIPAPRPKPTALASGPAPRGVSARRDSAFRQSPQTVLSLTSKYSVLMDRLQIAQLTAGAALEGAVTPATRSNCSPSAPDRASSSDVAPPSGSTAVAPPVSPQGGSLRRVVSCDQLNAKAVGISHEARLLADQIDFDIWKGAIDRRFGFGRIKSLDSEREMIKADLFLAAVQANSGVVCVVAGKKHPAKPR